MDLEKNLFQNFCLGMEYMSILISQRLCFYIERVLLVKQNESLKTSEATFQ